MIDTWIPFYMPKYIISYDTCVFLKKINAKIKLIDLPKTPEKLSESSSIFLLSCLKINWVGFWPSWFLTELSRIRATYVNYVSGQSLEDTSKGGSAEVSIERDEELLKVIAFSYIRAKYGAK